MAEAKKTTEKTPDFLNLEQAALKQAKEDAIRSAIEAKAQQHAQKIQLFLSYEEDARKCQMEADKLRAELELTDEEIGRLF